MKDPRRNLRSYRRKVTVERRRAERFGATCHVCNEAIDMSLPVTDRWAFTLNHLTALVAGGHILGETLPAHRSCNSKYGDGTKVDPLAGADRHW